MGKPGSILILKLSSLGDVVHALPLASALKGNIPGLRLGWVVQKGFSEIVENHPAVDDVFIFERSRGSIASIKNYFCLIREIRRKKYDIIIDLQGSMKSAAFVMLGGARSMGFKRGSSRVDPASTLFTGFKVEEPGGHIVERYLAFARVLGVKDLHPDFNLKAEEQASQDAARFLEKNGLGGKKIVIMHPGAAWKTKIWPAGNYIKLINMIYDKMPWAGVVITAGGGEEEAAAAIKAKCAGAPALAAGLSLDGLAALIDRCDVFIGSDSGPLHLAAALDKRVLGLYGPTDQARNGPFCKNSVVLKSRRKCAGCWKRTCPDNECMEDIKPEDVFKELEMTAGNA